MNSVARTAQDGMSTQGKKRLNDAEASENHVITKMVDIAELGKRSRS